MKLIIFTRNAKDRSDEELLGLFLQKRDPVLLGELYQRHIHLVFGLCMKYMKDVHGAKDAVMSIYEKIQTDIEKHEVKNFKSWLYVVSKNYCLMELRKIKPGRFTEIPNSERKDGFMEIDAELHPIDRQNKEEVDKALEECIEKLKEEQRRSILFFYYENKCYREIATILTTTENKVKSYIQNAKRNLKICMDKKNEKG